MKIFSDPYVPGIPLHSVISIGVFDGIHKGHQRILNLLEKLKKKYCCYAGVLTFSFLPKEPFYKGNFITPLEKRIELFKEYGVDFVIISKIGDKLTSLNGKDFIYNYLYSTLHIQAVVLGEDTKFGRNREMDTTEAKKYLQKIGIYTEVVPILLNKQGDKISSSSIRKYIEDGKLKVVRENLGRNFSIRGKVVKGEGRGRKLGFPTANIICKEYVLPPNGVYLTQTFVEDKLYKSLTYIGNNPTFNNTYKTSKIETFLIDYKGPSLYDRIIEIFFIDRLREEKKFKSIEDLKNQISQDIIRAKSIIS